MGNVTKKGTTTRAAISPLPKIDERAARSLDSGEAFDDELDPLGMSGLDGARPPNRHEAQGLAADAARPPNRYEARPPNRYEARPPNRYEARPPNRYEARPPNRYEARGLSTSAARPPNRYEPAGAVR